MSFIKLENVDKIYRGKFLGIKEASLELNINDKVLIRGDSGSGKTTLIKLCLGFLKQTNGKITINGKDINKFSFKEKKKFRNDIAFSFSNEIILENLTVEENISLISDDLKYIEEFDLLHVKDNLCGNLSGGEMKKVSIIKTLLSDASILVFDEPTDCLDDYSKKKFNEIISKIDNKLIIVISHDEAINKDNYNKFIVVSDQVLTIEETPHNISDYKFREDELSETFRINKLLFKALYKNVILKSICFSFLFIIALFLMLFMNTKVSSRKNANLVLNDFDNKYIINSNISKDELEDIKKRYNVEYVTNDVLFNSRTSLYVKNELVSGLVINLDNSLSFKEAKLSLPKWTKKYIENYNDIQFNEGFRDINGKNLFDITGIDYYVDNRIKPTIYISKESYDFSAIMFNYTDLNIANVNGKNYMIEINNSIPVGSFYQSNISDSIIDFVIYPKLRYLEDTKMLSTKIEKLDNVDFKTISNRIYINSKTLVNMFNKETSFKSATIVYEFESKDLYNYLSSNYNVINENIYIINKEYNIKTNLLIFSYFVIAIVFVIGFYILLDKLTIREKQLLENTIYGGLNNNYLRLYYLFNLAINGILALIFIVGIYFIVYYTELSRQFTYMPFYGYMIIYNILLLMLFMSTRINGWRLKYND